MAVKVGELYAKLTLNDAEFKKRLEDAEKKMGDVAKKASAAFAALAGSITAAAVAATNYQGEIEAVAKQTGLATESVQALGYAAARSEADLALLATGLRALVRRAAEAAQGNQAFAAYFDKLGISSQRLAELLRDPEQLIMEVADAMHRLPTEAEASAAAMNVMGDSGRRLVPFMRQGSGAIRELMDNAERLGLVMRKDGLEALSEFGDMWDDTRDRIAALTREIAVEFLPTLSSALDTINDVIDRIRSLDEGTRKLVSTIGSGTIGAVGAFASITAGIWAATRAMQALGSVFKLASGPAGWITLAATGLASIAAGLATAEKHAENLRKSILKFGTMEDVQSELDRVRGDLAKLRADLEAAGGPVESLEGVAWHTPEGRQMFAQAQRTRTLEAQIADLEAQEAELVARLEELRAEMEETAEDAPIVISVGLETPDESEAFKAWREAIEKAEREYQRAVNRILYEDPRTKDRSFAERELYESLLLERDWYVAIRDASYDILLNGENLLAEELEAIQEAFEDAGIRIQQLNDYLLPWAQKHLSEAYGEASLGTVLEPLDKINNRINDMRRLFETGRVGANTLLAELEEIGKQLAFQESLGFFGKPGSESYSALMDTEIAIAALRNQLQASLEQSPPLRIPVDYVSPTPEIGPDPYSIEPIRDAFALLGEQYRAGLVTSDEAISRTEGLIGSLLTTMRWGIENASEAQLRLYNQLNDYLDRLNERPDLIPVDLPTYTPEPGPRPEVLAQREIEKAFARLLLEVDAGLVSPGEGVARALEMRAQVLALARNNLAEATDDQINLWVRLTDAIQTFNDLAEVEASHLDEIRAEFNRAMGVGMAVERELAEALGQEFDETAYKTAVLQQHIEALAAEEGAITKEIEGHIRTLRLLAAEQERSAAIDRMVNSSIQSLLRNMGDLGRVLDGGVSFQAGTGFKVDWQTIMVNTIAAAAEALFAASDGSERTAQYLERAAEAIDRATRGWQEALSQSQFHELIGLNPQDEIAALQQAIAANEHRIRRLRERWLQVWNAASRAREIEALERQNDEMERRIKELESGWEGDLEQRITELLGVGTRELQGAVASAFSSATIEDFTTQMEHSLTAKVRNAFVTAFLESEMMSPLFEGLGDAIREAVMDSEITPGEIDGIRDMMDAIEESSKPFYELLREFGLLADVTDRLNQQFARLYNVPLGYKALQELRYGAATPQVVPSLMGAQAGTYFHIEHLEVRDYDSFQRQMEQYQRRQGLVTTGNPMGGRWRR